MLLNGTASLSKQGTDPVIYLIFSLNYCQTQELKYSAIPSVHFLNEQFGLLHKELIVNLYCCEAKHRISYIISTLFCDISV